MRGENSGERSCRCGCIHERELRYEGVIFGVGAIHRGLDATNRLAVLMRGSSYIFFVNGQFVGGYQANDLPQSGQVGVYVELMNGPITFSDLLISPPPASA